MAVAFSAVAAADIAQAIRSVRRAAPLAVVRSVIIGLFLDGVAVQAALKVGVACTSRRA